MFNNLYFPNIFDFVYMYNDVRNILTININKFS